MEKQLVRLFIGLWAIEVAILAAVTLLGSSSPPAQAAQEMPAPTSIPIRYFQLPTRTGTPWPSATPTPTSTPTPTATPTPLPTATPTSTPLPGRPVRVQIPAIEIDSLIEPVGLTEENEMEAPAAWDAVGWFKHGFRPGQIGGAVLTGHLDTNTGAPAAFWRLSELQVGDTITVETDLGQSYVFAIESVNSYPYDQAPLDLIFGAAGEPRLSLVTCNGIWDPQARIYDQRLVVFASLTKSQSKGLP